MNIIKSNINFKINLYQNEGLPKLKTDICIYNFLLKKKKKVPPHFLITICGKPGSGKVKKKIIKIRQHY